MKFWNFRRMALFAAVLCLFSSVGVIWADNEKAEKQLTEEMIRGSFEKARQMAVLNEIKSERAGIYLSVLNYLNPSWQREDFSQLKKNAPASYELMKKIIEAPVPDKIDKDMQIRMIYTKIRLLKALAELSPKDALLLSEKLLNTNSPALNLGAVEALETIRDDKCCRILYDYLKTEKIPTFKSVEDIRDAARINEIARARALGAIVRIGGGDLTPELMKEAENTGSPDRMTAVVILTGLRMPRAVPLYKKLLLDADEQVVIYGASALRDMGDNSGFEKIASFFKRGDVKRKLWLTEILSGWEGPGAVKILLEYLKEKCGLQAPLKEGPSLTALGRVPPLDRMTDPEPLLMAKIVQLLIKWKSTSVPVLKSELPEARGNLKYLILEILGESEDPTTPALFREYLKSEDPVTQYYCIWGLGRMQDKSSIAVIKPFLNSKNRMLSGASAWALARMGDSEGYPICMKMLESSSVQEKGTALDALYALKNPESSGKILELLATENQDPALERLAMTVLGVLGYAGAENTLLQKAGKTGINSYYAAEALYRITGVMTPFSLEKMYPWELSYYGDGLYTSMDCIRGAVLYISLQPDEFFPVSDFSLGYGRAEGPENSISLYRDSEKDDVADSLPSRTPLLVKGFKGFRVQVAALDGREGWIHSDCINLIEESSAGTAGRFRSDFGYRWKKDLLKMLKEDYLNNREPKVEYENLPALSAAYHCGFALNAALNLSGRKSVDEGRGVFTVIDTGRKYVTISTEKPSLTYTLTYGGTGRLEKIQLKP